MQKNTLYLECYSGISGDMTVAALLDLGADTDVLTKGLKSLNVDGYRIKISRQYKNSIEACDFDVILENTEELEATGTVENGDGHFHVKLGCHEHRNLYDINAIIDGSAITPNAKCLAKKIFRVVALAEAKAHGKPLENIYFHEVGAVDSIVDIVSAAICLDNLKITEVIVTELYDGTGQIRCRHGLIPVPVPAVVNIAADYHIPIHITGVSGELVTPTGAAIAAATRTCDRLPEDFIIKKIGLGAGKRDYGHAGILRAMIIE